MKYDLFESGIEFDENIIVRIVGIRKFKNTMFIDFLFLGKQGQAMIGVDDVSSKFRIGDLVELQGKIGKNNKGGIIYIADSVHLIVKSEYDLSSVHKGVTREQQLILDPQFRTILQTKFKIVSLSRDFLQSQGFDEVQTNSLLNSAGASSSRPFKTRYGTSNDLELRKTMEGELRKLQIAGFDRIYELGNVFVNEGNSKNHLPERTMLEGISSYMDIDGIIKLSRELIFFILEGCNAGIDINDIEILTFEDFIIQYLIEFLGKNSIKIEDIFNYLDGKNIIYSKTEDYYSILAKVYSSIKRKIILGKKMLIIYNFPNFMAPLAKDFGNGVGGDFKLFINGISVIHGSEDENDYRNYISNSSKQDNGIDTSLLEAMKLGSIPSASMGLGIDRLVQEVLGVLDIRVLSGTKF